MSTLVPDKDPQNIEPYFFVFCSKDGTNTGSTPDTGDLQGATISSITSVTAQSGLTVDSSNKNAVTVAGVNYGVNTVVTAWYSGGVDGQSYEVECKVVTSDQRTLTKTMLVPVRQL